MRTTVKIRVDGNAEMGHGHYTRCTALAQMIANRFDCCFYSRFVPETAVSELQNEGFELRKIDSEKAFLDTLQPGDLVVIDGYHFTRDYQLEIRVKGALLLVIDDAISGEYAAHVLINQAPGLQPEKFILPAGAQFAFGPDYVLLRRAYREMTSSALPAGDPNMVFVCFGGADPLQLTVPTVKTLVESGAFSKIIAVTGSGFQGREALSDYIGSKTEIEHCSGLSASGMIEKMLECGVALVPASVILYEALALKRKVISGCYIDNQLQMYNGLKKLNAFTDAGTFRPEELQKAVGEIKTHANETPLIIDGFAAFRYQNLFTFLENKDGFYLRRALPEDVEATYNWAKDPLVRAHSFNRDEIRFEEHAQWFGKKIRHPECWYYLAVNGGELIGSIRFDLDGDQAIISYLLAPRFHGKGFGHRLLQAGMETILSDRDFRRKNPKTIIGWVVPANIPSVKTFEKLNFERTEDGDSIRFSYHIA